MGNPDLAREASRVAAALKSLVECFGIDRDRVIYVSTPITTGRRYYDWRRTVAGLSEADPNFEALHQRNVEDPNRASAHELVLALRRTVGPTVIDPTALDVVGWEQEDYHNFWVWLVEGYIGTVVFNDGWEYSTGCAREYAAAVRAGATTLSASLSPRKASVALMLIDSAIVRMSAEHPHDHRLVELRIARHEISEASGSNQQLNEAIS
jgi:hypothetical protein